MHTAIITGGTRGLGREITQHLVAQGWTVIFDARRHRDVDRYLDELRDTGHAGEAVGISGDVADLDHCAELAEAVGDNGLDLLVNNASSLGPTPLPRLADLDPGAFIRLLRTNTVAPLQLFRLLVPALERAEGAIVNISSDAAVEAYGGWGGYGASKAALDQLTNILAIEHPTLGVYAFDPGDMRTDMHQAAFPGDDISDRPAPVTVVPSLMRLVTSRPASGRYTSSELASLPVSR